MRAVDVKHYIQFFFIYFINKDKTRHQDKLYTTSAFIGHCIKCIPYKCQPLNQLLICLEMYLGHKILHLGAKVCFKLGS